MARLWYDFVIFVTRLLFVASGGYRSHRRDRVPRKGSLLVAPNHCSHLDPPLVAISIPRRLNFMAKEELFEVKFLGPLIKSVGAFPVKRGERDTEAVRMALSLLKAGNAMLMFPEGTRGDGKTLGPVNRGVTLLAKRSGAAVLPVLVVGTATKMPRGGSKINRKMVDVWFGEPFTYEDIAKLGGDRENRDLFAETWQKRMLALAEEAGVSLSVSTSSPGSTESGHPD